MSNTVLSIQVENRGNIGSSNSRRMRKAGLVPAVVYGHGGAASSITVKADDLASVVHHAGLLNLDIAGGETKAAIVKEVQLHPIQDYVLHIDFQEVKADEKIHSHAAIESHGTPAGAVHGGQLEQILHELEIRSLPADMIETIVVDVTALKVDDTLHVRDLVLPQGVEALADPELPVFQVRIPRIDVETEETAETEGEPAAAKEEE
jgi:large subunit ribosomal protein L25